MNDLFNIIGYIFGYVLKFAYWLVPNFAVALLIFTIILRAVQFPFQIKSQKSMAGTARLQKKQQELQEKYGKDKNKLNEEISKLYEKENVNPMGGCLTSLLPMILLLGVYGTVRNPITNVLHIASDKVQEAVNYITGLPVVGSTVNQTYSEISLINLFPYVKDNLDCFSGSDVASIENFANGFNLFGINLLDTPSNYGIFSVFMLLPVLCFVTSFGMSFISMRINGNNMSMGQQQGCMKAMFLILPLFSAWIVYSVPAAVGVYYIYSNLIGVVTTIILHKFYNAEIMTATEEARRIALLTEEEKSVKAVTKKYSGNSVKPANKKQKNKKK